MIYQNPLEMFKELRTLQAVIGWIEGQHELASANVEDTPEIPGLARISGKLAGKHACCDFDTHKALVAHAAKMIPSKGPAWVLPTASWASFPKERSVEAFLCASFFALFDWHERETRSSNGFLSSQMKAYDALFTALGARELLQQHGPGSGGSLHFARELQYSSEKAVLVSSAFSKMVDAACAIVLHHYRFEPIFVLGVETWGNRELPLLRDAADTLRHPRFTMLAFAG